jgi:hypothetical protein
MWYGNTRVANHYFPNTVLINKQLFLLKPEEVFLFIMDTLHHFFIPRPMPYYCSMGIQPSSAAGGGGIAAALFCRSPQVTGFFRAARYPHGCKATWQVQLY